MSEEYKEERTPVCSICGNTCKGHQSNNPAWYGSYENEKLVKTICIDCWKEGKRFNK